MLTKPFTLALLLALGAHAAAADTDRHFINGERSTAQTPPPISDGVLVGNTLYISGHLSIDPKTGHAPADPQATVAAAPDIGIQTNGPVTVVLQTQNFPTTGTVALRVVPTYAASWITNAAFVSGSSAFATWQLTARIPVGYCVLQAHATSP